MNYILAKFARDFLKERLPLCTESEQLLFKRMYSYQNLDKTIDQVVDDLPTDKLDWAMVQVDNTLKEKAVM